MICDRLWLIEDESDPTDDLITLLLDKLNIFVEQRKGKLEFDTGYHDFAIFCIRFTVVYFRGRQAPPKPDAKGVLPGKLPPKIPSLLTM